MKFALPIIIIGNAIGSGLLAKSEPLERKDSLRTSPLLRIDSLMHARERAQLLMPLLILGSMQLTRPKEVT